MGSRSLREWTQPVSLADKSGKLAIAGNYVEAQMDQPDSIESKVKSLLEIVSPHAEQIASLKSSCSIHVQLVYRAWLSNGHLGGLGLSSEDLSAIGAMGADLDFDTYASGPWL